MGSSAVLRRWFSRSGIFRSHRSYGVDCDYSLFLGNSCRMMSSSEAASVPWLMLPACLDGSGNMSYRFHSLGKKEVLSCENKISSLELPEDIDIIKDVKFVGSSHGWVALYNRRNLDLFLSNPITDRHIKLPSLHSLADDEANRVILSEKGSLAFMIFGWGEELALCAPLRSHEWTLFGGGKINYRYENLVYSSRRKRLFCVCETGSNLMSFEGWDVGEGEPRLDWEIQPNKELDFDNAYFRWPARSEFKKRCHQMKYLVCDEYSDDLFLVVRHVNIRAGPHGSIIDEVVFSKYRGRQFINIPYKTVDFDVFKIDVERGKVVHMDNSLEGLTMFVGINHPFAIRSPEVKPNSVYFTDENRLVEHSRLERTNYGGHDNGIFDYQNKDFSPCCTFYPIEYHKIRKILPLPMWSRSPN
ncbi:hypothetical protein C2S51_015025 [Perilla frutescens var. frutescens]|nr:hypothetical protein C2S51_015025 [Perilla frutescens var. frutescens]